MIIFTHVIDIFYGILILLNYLLKDENIIKNMKFETL